MFKQKNLLLFVILLLVVFCVPFMAFGEEIKAKLLLPNCMSFEPRGNIASMDENKQRLTLEEGAVRYNIWVSKTTKLQKVVDGKVTDIVFSDIKIGDEINAYCGKVSVAGSLTSVCCHCLDVSFVGVKPTFQRPSVASNCDESTLNTIGKDIGSLESFYKKCPEGELRALSLQKLEDAIIENVRQSGVTGRFVLSDIQPSKEAEPVRITIQNIDPAKYEFFETTVSNLKDDNRYLAWRELIKNIFPFMLKMESTKDRIEIIDASPHFSLGDGSIVRFIEDVPFPLQQDKIKRLGMISFKGWLAYQDPNKVLGLSTKNTNSSVITLRPILNSIVVKGDKDDPLSFVLLNELGFVYLHGKGSIIKADGTIVNLPKGN